MAELPDFANMTEEQVGDWFFSNDAQRRAI